MNRAINFPCPGCGHKAAVILEFIKKEGFVVSYRLLCLSCEHIYEEFV
jgi:uncharacterized Zn finger protein